MITIWLQRATIQINVEKSNQRSALVTTVRAAHPRNTAICVNTLNMFLVLTSETKLIYGLLGLYSWAYYISVFKSILKTLFPW